MEFVRIKNGDIVRHFKKETTDGSNPYQYLYRVINTDARETDNYNRVVVYEALYDNGGGTINCGTNATGIIPGANFFQSQVSAVLIIFL